MPDIDAQIRAIKNRIEAAQSKRAGAEHEQRVAQAAAAQALSQLKEEFGCARIEDADELLHDLEQQAAAECSRVEAALAAVEDGS